MSDRRAFLSGLVSLPLIGGGVTLIGRPAAAVPLVQVAALPTLDDPRQRARYAWEAFSSAMDDLTADAHGWRLYGGGRVHGGPQSHPCAWLRLSEVRQEMSVESEVLFESHREIALDLAEEAILRSCERRRRAAGVPLTGGRHV